MERNEELGTNLRITVAASQGGRRYMEDRVFIHTERKADNSLKWTFLGVFDGHGGEHASEFVRRNLLDNIINNEKFHNDDDDDDILAAIREGFLTTHNMMKEVHDEWPFTPSGYPSTAGTTVSCVFIRNGKLYTGHVGDSAIYLGVYAENGVRALPLTVDHKPECMREQERIREAGGSTAVKSGVTRIVWRRPAKNQRPGPVRRNSSFETIPFLSVARSLGDLWSYNESTDSYVVSPIPDVDVYVLNEQDFCLILASDGMTNVMPAEQAVSIVYREEELVEMHNDMNRNHARCVLRSTLQKWRSLRADNVTVATVIFDPDMTSYREKDVLMKLGPFLPVDQVLTDRPDGLLHVSKNRNVILRTKRTPVVYNGSKDANFSRVSYRGPGFRTHEEEMQEEKNYITARNLIIKRNDDDDDDEDERRLRIVTGEDVDDDDDDDEDIEYDEDDDDTNMSIPFGQDSVLQLKVSNEMVMNGAMATSSQVIETRIYMVPSPIRPSNPEPRSPIASMSTFEPDDGTDEEDLDATPSKMRSSPTKSPMASSSVRRVKARACRRLRTPKMEVVEERRVTRSSSRADALKTPSPIKINQTPGSRKRSDSTAATSSATPLRRSSRLTSDPTTSTPASPPVGQNAPQSRKRGREDLKEKAMNKSGVTPAINMMKIVEPDGEEAPPTPSRSAPSTPLKAGPSKGRNIKASKWSLSKLEAPKPQVEIVRVCECADDDDVGEELSEPPSKIRRIYGFMKRLVGWPSK
ncbi:unnamed protein product [Caenorhabditis bovis]|uniref:PPM-type phosphatase domain-containing protein n=1 Tax=Caenorhabditis bovis TaxID=2654633 RepID=A0A8S1ER14_9PELO|nr:unnamed protein product [Caenorhabditis bovis]